MTIDEIKKDTEFWQRMLRLAGYYTGKIDGIAGRLTREAEALWEQNAAKYKREYGEYDDRSEGVLATLLPKAQKKMRQWLSMAQQQAMYDGMEVKLIDGTRSYAEQNKLYNKKPKVTNARGGYSWHNFGLAADFGLFSGKAYITDDAKYKPYGRLASMVENLEWGGEWKKFVDMPHLQLKMFSSTAEARAKF